MKNEDKERKRVTEHIDNMPFPSLGDPSKRYPVELTEPEIPTHIDLRDRDGSILATVPILRTITLRGISGFCIHQYEDEYRISHIETGAVLCTGMDDGEVFVRARRFDKVEIESKIAATRRELEHLWATRRNRNQRTGESTHVLRSR